MHVLFLHTEVARKLHRRMTLGSAVDPEVARKLVKLVKLSVFQYCGTSERTFKEELTF